MDLEAPGLWPQQHLTTRLNPRGMQPEHSSRCTRAPKGRGKGGCPRGRGYEKKKGYVHNQLEMLDGIVKATEGSIGIVGETGGQMSSDERQLFYTTFCPLPTMAVAVRFLCPPSTTNLFQPHPSTPSFALAEQCPVAATSLLDEPLGRYSSHGPHPCCSGFVQCLVV